MSGTVEALLYLKLTSLRNGLVSRLARLKQPKYFAGALVATGYLYFFVFRNLSHMRPAKMPHIAPGIVITYGALLMTIAVILFWVWPRARAALNFSEAEIGFLFPAPISRRALVHYSLITSQIKIAVSALLLALLFQSRTAMPGHLVIRALGWWLVMGTGALHLTASSFVITRLHDRGLTTIGRQAITVVLLMVLAGAVYLWHQRYAPHAVAQLHLGAINDYIAGQTSSGPVAWLLMPASWLLRPMFAGGPLPLLQAMVPALAIYAAHYVWVLKVQVAFEEASIAHAERRAAMFAAARSGNRLTLGTPNHKARRARFRLSASGRPEIAFLWKNLLATADYCRPRTALITAAVIVLLSLWLNAHPALAKVSAVFGSLALISAGYVLLFGPLLARQDLRGDLRNADILKAYPLAGWQVVLGELLTPVAILTVLIWLLLLMAGLLFYPPRSHWLTLGLRLWAGAALILAAPLLCALELLVVNAATLLFPAWLSPSPQGGAVGIERMGLRLVFLAGQVLVIMAAVIPPGFFALIVFLVSRWLFGTHVAGICAGATVLVVLAVEVFDGVAWLGRRFEAFDLSTEQD